MSNLQKTPVVLCSCQLMCVFPALPYLACVVVCFVMFCVVFVYIFTVAHLCRHAFAFVILCLCFVLLLF